MPKPEIKVEEDSGGHDIFGAGAIGSKVSPKHLVIMVNSLVGSTTVWRFTTERLIAEMAFLEHNVYICTPHHDQNRCFEETRADQSKFGSSFKWDLSENHQMDKHRFTTVCSLIAHFWEFLELLEIWKHFLALFEGDKVAYFMWWTSSMEKNVQNGCFRSNSCLVATPMIELIIAARKMAKSQLIIF